MKQIKITIGVSNAGKSTWSNEQWKKDPFNTVIVNRDKIRELLFGFTEASVKEYYNSPDIQKFEKVVSKYEDTIIHEALSEDKTVIVDATNLYQDYIERFKFWNVPIELVWFDISLEDALERNRNRSRSVPEDVIKSHHKKYLKLKESFTWDYKPAELLTPRYGITESVYLLDIDGTIAHMNGGRSPFDWKNVGRDDVCLNLLPVVNAIIQQSKDYPGSPKLIIVSGRDGVCRNETLEWLERFGIEGGLLMRPEKDMRADWKIKEEIWRELYQKYNILGLFDDRLQVVRRARALGLKVFNVEYNNF